MFQQRSPEVPDQLESPFKIPTLGPSSGLGQIETVTNTESFSTAVPRDKQLPTEKIIHTSDVISERKYNTVEKTAGVEGFESSLHQPGHTHPLLRLAAKV